MSNNNLKVPSQIFRWFEKMKSNYESSVQSVLSKFEAQTFIQQEKIDKAHQEHIDSLKEAHQEQLQSQQRHIEQLSQDIQFYKQQLASHQQTIEQLNSRYDTVMAYMVKDQPQNSNIKNVVLNDPMLNGEDEAETDPIQQNTTSTSAKNDEEINKHIPTQDAEEYYQNGLAARTDKDYAHAIDCFMAAASLQHASALGALARAYFLAEGVDEDPIEGLAYLIKAASTGLPQAQARVEMYKEQDPELYALAQQKL